MGDAYQIQLRRATAAENAAFTGAAGELVFEEDNDLVYIHDGSTAGGHLLPRTAAQILALLSGQALEVATIDTGQGAVECYPMNQGMRTTDSVAHNDLALTGALNVRGFGGSATNRLKATYNGGAGIAVFGPDSSGSSTQIQIGTSNAGSFASRLTIDSSGRVGIGGINPSTLLHIETTDPTFRFKRSDAGTNAYGEITVDTAGLVQVKCDPGGAAGGSGLRVSVDGSTAAEINTTAATFSVPVHLKSYTVATLPSASTAAGLIYVSDEAGGAVPAFSDGTNWRRVTDRAVVS